MPKYEFYVIEKWTDTIEVEADTFAEAQQKADEYLDNRDMGRAVIDCHAEFNGEVQNA